MYISDYLIKMLDAINTYAYDIMIVGLIASIVFGYLIIKVYLNRPERKHNEEAKKVWMIFRVYTLIAFVGIMAAVVEDNGLEDKMFDLEDKKYEIFIE